MGTQTNTDTNLILKKGNTHKYFLLKIITQHAEWYAFNVDDNIQVFQKWLKQLAVVSTEFGRKYNASEIVRCIVMGVNRGSAIVNYLQIQNNLSYLQCF